MDPPANHQHTPEVIYFLSAGGESLCESKPWSFLGVRNGPSELWGRASPERGERVTRTTGPSSWTDFLLGAGWVLLRSAVFVLPNSRKMPARFLTVQTPNLVHGLEQQKRPLFHGHQFQYPYFTVDFERKAPSFDSGHASFRGQNANPFPLAVKLFIKLLLVT